VGARGAGVFAAGFIAACVAAATFTPAVAEPIAVSAAPIPLYPNSPAERRAGALLYRGGLLLSSSDKRFGGLSDLAVNADGSEILSVSDEARWLSARLTYDEAGNLAGLNSVEIAPMLNLAGRPMRGKAGDAEGLTLERANDLHGPVIVSFERNVRVWRYDLSKGFSARPENIAIGNWVLPLKENAQLEALTLVKPDTLLVFAESRLGTEDIRGAFEAYPGNGHASTRTLSVVPHDPFSVTSTANAPDGGIFILERRYSLMGGVGMELRHVPTSELREGARLEGEVLANLSFQDSNIDNMEGIAVRRGPKGETLLYLLSDNNFSSLQRTLLLMFELGARQQLGRDSHASHFLSNIRIKLDSLVYVSVSFGGVAHSDLGDAAAKERSAPSGIEPEGRVIVFDRCAIVLHTQICESTGIKTVRIARIRTNGSIAVR
jgi:hypothetical protein